MAAMVKVLHTISAKPGLDELYAHFNLEQSVADPIWIVRRYARSDDQEIVAFVASALAFGRVQSVLNSVEAVLRILGPSPAAFVRDFDPGRDRAAFDAIGHRWTRGPDLAALVWILHQMLDRAESIEGFFALAGDSDEPDVEGRLESFSRRALGLDVKAVYGRTRPRPGVAYFFSRPSSGGACKRLNLFLRWMVRRDQIDLGLWSHVRPAQLVVPLDTHVIRVGQCLGLTRYKSPGWRMAADITKSLRGLDPIDPIKYDFSICHLGMMSACGFGTPAGDARCPLRGACRPRPLPPRVRPSSAS